MVKNMMKTLNLTMLIIFAMVSTLYAAPRHNTVCLQCLRAPAAVNSLADKDLPEALGLNIKSSSSGMPERLVLKDDTGPRTFLVTGTLYNSRRLLLAEEEATGKLFVIKKAITEEQERELHEIYGINNVPESYPHIYKPKLMNAGPGTWAGLEDGIAIVYPYEPGQSFFHRFRPLKQTTMSYHGLELLDAVIKITDIALYLEQCNVPGIWDIRPSNILMKPDDTPMLIDYRIMNVEPIHAIEWLLYVPFLDYNPKYQCYTHEGGVPVIISKLRFAKFDNLDKAIKDLFLVFHEQTDKHAFASLAEFKKGLINLRQNIARYILKDLIRDWQNYTANKDIIRKLTLELLGVDRAEDFRPVRPVRVIIGAAGLGTRMGSNRPKSLEHVCGEPIIYHVFKETAFLDANPIVVVRSDAWKDGLGNEGQGGNHQQIRESLEQGGFEAEYAFQSYLKGDGYAVLSAKDNLKDFDGDVLVTWGDMAVLNPETIKWLTMIHQALEDVPLSIATTAKETPYAPVMDDENARIVGSKKGISLAFGRDDVGVFVADAKSMFKALSVFPKDEKGDFINPYDGSVNKKGEMNFVQIASILAQEGGEVIAPPLADIREFQGVNTPEELKQAERYRTEMMMENAFVIPAADLAKRQRQITAAIKIAA